MIFVSPVTSGMNSLEGGRACTNRVSENCDIPHTSVKRGVV